VTLTGSGSNTGWGVAGSPNAITADAAGVAGEITWVGGTTPDGLTEQTEATPYTIVSPLTSGSPVEVNLSSLFGNSGVAQPLTLNFGTYDGSAGVTQFSNSNTAVSVSNFSQNGLPQGSFNNLSVDTSGNVSINYSNGTNKVIAQIPVAQFYAQDELQQISGGAYSSTLASGNPRLGAPGLNGAGTLSSSSLEQSNVDISTQFTDLIQAQQVYSANAKVVTTDDSLLQVTLNMIQ
jgi:flagellar hook protein FlgE